MERNINLQIHESAAASVTFLFLLDPHLALSPSPLSEHFPLLPESGSRSKAWSKLHRRSEWRTTDDSCSLTVSVRVQRERRNGSVEGRSQRERRENKMRRVGEHRQ
jgi:hypothetical protein